MLLNFILIFIDCLVHYKTFYSLNLLFGFLWFIISRMHRSLWSLSWTSMRSLWTSSFNNFKNHNKFDQNIFNNSHDKSADPWLLPPEDPSEEFSNKFVTPPTIEEIMWEINSKKYPLPLEELSLVPRFCFVCSKPLKKLSKNICGWGPCSSSGSLKSILRKNLIRKKIKITALSWENKVPRKFPKKIPLLS